MQSQRKPNNTQSVRLTTLLVVLALVAPAVASQPPHDSLPRLTSAPQQLQPSVVPLPDKLASVPAVVSGDVASPCQRVQQRPCIALVLGGGGARGGAHVAVLRQLEAQQVPIDLIVGSSIGAFVGGLYASGKSPDEIARLLQQLPWSDGFRDQVARDEVPLRRKQQRDQFPLNPNIGVDAGGLKVPRGVLHGQAMAALIQQAYGLEPELASFDLLSVPFRAVATDLATRAEVVLGQGNLLQAVQASMSIPGVVRPLQLNGRLLVDGGVANNLPVTVAKALGADRVIAVGIDAPLLNNHQLTSAVAVTEQLTNFLVAEAVARQLAALTADDILIQPVMPDIGTLDFSKINAAMHAGQQAVAMQKTRLGRLSEPAFYANWQQRQRSGSSSTRLSAIALENQTRFADALLLRRLELPLDQPLTIKELQQGIRRIYGFDQLEKVSTTLQNDGTGAQRLLLKAEPKSWGPAYLQFRLQLEDDFENTHNYQLGMMHLWTGLSPFGAEWQNEIALGTDKLLASKFYWPFGLSDFYAELSAVQSRIVFSLEDQQGLSNGELSQRELALSSALGWQPLDPLQISLALTRQDGRFRLPSQVAALLQFSSLPYLRHGTIWQFHYDSLDSRSFPSRGLRLEASWQALDDQYLQARSSSDTYSLHGQWAAKLDQHILRSRLRFERVDGPANLIELDQFSLGGLLNLSGYPKNYLFGGEVRFASLIYQYQLPDSRFSFFNAPFYLGTSLERGFVKGSRFSALRDVGRDHWIWAGSVFAGWDSPFGPLYLGYGQAQNDFGERPYRFYLALGQLF